jgi:hypothetical protein
MPAEKTQSFCPWIRALNRSGKGLMYYLYVVKNMDKIILV